MITPVTAVWLSITGTKISGRGMRESYSMLHCHHHTNTALRWKAQTVTVLFYRLWRTTLLNSVHHQHHHYPSRLLTYRAAMKLLYPCLSLASLWMVPQLWFIFFISASTVLQQVVFGRPHLFSFWGPVDCNFGDGVGILMQHVPNPVPSLPGGDGLHILLLAPW